MSYLSRKSCCVYTHPEDDAQAHAEYVLSLMGSGCHYSSSLSSDKKEEEEEDYLFMIPNPKWKRMNLKYVLKKDRKNIYVLVSCSKKCEDCHGCSPGCGKNFECERINLGISSLLTHDDWLRIWNASNDRYRADYICIPL